MKIKIVAVIEISIAGGRVADIFSSLMDWVIVPRRYRHSVPFVNLELAYSVSTFI